MLLRFPSLCLVCFAVARRCETLALLCTCQEIIWTSSKKLKKAVLDYMRSLEKMTIDNLCVLITYVFVDSGVLKRTNPNDVYMDSRKVTLAPMFRGKFTELAKVLYTRFASVYTNYDSCTPEARLKKVVSIYRERKSEKSVSLVTFP